MAYRKTSKYAAQLAAMRAAKAARRMAAAAPDYPSELPALRREILIIDHDFGRREHRLKRTGPWQNDSAIRECGQSGSQWARRPLPLQWFLLWVD